MRDGHLTEREIAGFLDRDLVAAERRVVEEHLDRCAGCRRELAAVARLVDSPAGIAERGAYGAGLPPAAEPAGERSAGRAAGRRRRSWAAPVAALAAAAVAAILLVGPDPDPTPTAPVIRAPARADVNARPGGIEVASPAERIQASGAPVAFVWRPSGATDIYRFSLLAEGGEPIWSAETADTTVSLPASATLEPGRTYFWRVDAIADGVVLTTGVRRLEVGS